MSQETCLYPSVNIVVWQLSIVLKRQRLHKKSSYMDGVVISCRFCASVNGSGDSKNRDRCHFYHAEPLSGLEEARRERGTKGDTA